MPTDETMNSRIERLLAAGSLTAEEAERLRASPDAGASRNAAAGPGAARDPSRRRMAPLMILLLLAFALGALSGWLYTASMGVPVAVVSTRQPENPRRLIDLQNIDSERNLTMNRSLPLLTAVIPLAVLTVLGFFVVLGYNALVGAREQVNAGWAQVENVYQRRLDLVPVLVDTVQTYTEHERETLAEVTRARSAALQLSGIAGDGAPETAEQLQAIETSQGSLASALTRLFAVVEGYPELKASRNFLSLQDQLEGTENRVAMERRSYNEFSRRYNTRLQTFPSNLIASMMGFESKPYFQAEEGALGAPEDPFGRHSG